MDRQTVFTQALGRSTDFLQAQQNTMVALGWAAQGVLGTATAVDGFTLAPTSPASLVANLGPGAVYQLENVEASTWSSLPANTASIVKQGLMQAVDPITFVPPPTVGYAQNFLVEVQYADLDTTPVLLPYYNSSNPAQPYQGPGNNGVSQSTQRLGIAAIQVKAGVAATSGTQVTPTPDAGWVGLFVVTLAQGATSVTAGNIATYSAAPFIPAKLPAIPAGVQSGAWVYGTAAGTNTYTTTLFSTSAYPYARTVGMEILVNFANANTTTTPTLAENGQTAAQIRKQNGAAPSAGDLASYVPLIWDGTYWRLNGLASSDVNNKAPITVTGAVTPQSGQLYLQDLGVYATFTLPNPASLSPGWFCDHIMTATLATGYQTSYTSVASGAGTQNLLYHGTIHNPFYLIGAGEGFRYYWTGTQWLVLTLSQAQNPLIRRGYTGSGQITGSGANTLMTLNSSSGNTAVFNAISGGVQVPVSGSYGIYAAAAFGSGGTPYQPWSVTVGDTVALALNYFGLGGNVNSANELYPKFFIQQYLTQGSTLVGVLNDSSSSFYDSSISSLTVVLLSR